MTVSTGGVTHSYFPGTAMVAEAIPFQFLDAEHLRINIIGEDDAQILGTDYRIDGDGRTATGSITTLRAYGSDEELLIRRFTPRAQEAVTDAFKPLPAEAVGRSLDQRTMAEQEVDDAFTRLPVLPDNGALPVGNVPVVTADGYEFLPEKETADRYYRWPSVTATAGQTDFTFPGLGIGPFVLKVNGVPMEEVEHFTVSGETITLLTPCEGGEDITNEQIGIYSTLLKSSARNVRARDRDNRDTDLQSLLNLMLNGGVRFDNNQPLVLSTDGLVDIVYSPGVIRFRYDGATLFRMRTDGGWGRTPKAVADLGTTMTVGDRDMVNDAVNGAFNDIAVGGGGLVRPVWFDGGNWRIG